MFYRVFTTSALAIGTMILLLSIPTVAGPAMKAPQWTLTSIDGQQINFPGKSSKPAVVLFWASWCAYCKGLLTGMSELQADFSEKVDFIAINFSANEKDKLPDFAMETPFKHFINGDDVADLYGVTSVPALFIVKNGLIEYKLDYPPSDHPSQKQSNTRKKIQLLVPWWQARLKEQLTMVSAK